MGLEIHPLSLGDVHADSSFAVWQMTPGTPILLPITAYLILGGDEPIIVDTGFSESPDLLAANGGAFERSAEQTLSANLARHGLEPADIGLILHTHLHTDHCGLDDQMPNARILVQRRELEYAAAPLFPRFIYDPRDIAKLVAPLWERVELLDGDTTIAPGIRTVFTAGHSPGHQMIYVEVDSGLAAITGDVVYLTDPAFTQQLPPGHYTDLHGIMSALTRLRREADYILPMHDRVAAERYAGGVR